MADWWMSLGAAGQVFACIAIPASVILLAQTVMMLIGLGGNGDGDADGGDAQIDGVGIDTDGDGVIDGFDTTGDGLVDTPIPEGYFDGGHDGHAEAHDGSLRLFTMRGLIAFFSVMGWVGVVCCSDGIKLPLSIGIAVISGFAAMVVVALIMKWMLSLQYDGTENIKNALGTSGNVYIRVPSNRGGTGKVNIVLQGKLTEKDAVTDEATDLTTGEEITVIGISGEDTLIVRRKSRA